MNHSNLSICPKRMCSASSHFSIEYRSVVHSVATRAFGIKWLGSEMAETLGPLGEASRIAGPRFASCSRICHHHASGVRRTTHCATAYTTNATSPRACIFVEFLILYYGLSNRYSDRQWSPHGHVASENDQMSFAWDR